MIEEKLAKLEYANKMLRDLLEEANNRIEKLNDEIFLLKNPPVASEPEWLSWDGGRGIHDHPFGLENWDKVEIMQRNHFTDKGAVGQFHWVRPQFDWKDTPHDIVFYRKI